MGRLFAVIIVLFIHFRTVIIYMTIQWLSRVISVVMKFISLNKHRLSWSGTNIISSHTMGMDTSSGDTDANMSLLQTNAKKKKKIQNKNDSPLMKCGHYSCWNKENRDKSAKCGLAQKTVYLSILLIWGNTNLLAPRLYIMWPQVILAVGIGHAESRSRAKRDGPRVTCKAMHLPYSVNFTG